MRGFVLHALTLAMSPTMKGELSIRIQELRVRVCALNKELERERLVVSTYGNVSGRDPESGCIVIKPSGVRYPELRPHMLPVLDKAGKRISGEYNPSVDLPNHLYLYQHLPEINGVVHTHSNYATAFAALGRSIPLVLTGMADEFGEEIPCAPYATNSGEAIGQAILKARKKGPAVLLQNHGVFTFAESPEKAVKAAVMCEDAAKTVWLAMQLGNPIPLPPEEAKKWWDRYHSWYGQEEKK